MTNTALLDAKIKESGKKKKYLAEKIGLTYAGFRNCCLNKSEFKARHIMVLCEELNLTEFADIKAIFFTPDVALKAKKCR